MDERKKTSGDGWVRMERFEELKNRLKQVKSSEATEIKVYEVLFKC